MQNKIKEYANGCSSMNAAAKMHRDRMKKQRLHHIERLEWLSESAPTWSCGRPVSNGDVKEMARDSRRWLSENAYQFEGDMVLTNKSI